jgi:spore coat protein U-like protein
MSRLAAMLKTIKTFSILIALMGMATSCFAAATTISVSATILSQSNCKFNTKSAILAFGTLDPLATAAPDVTSQTTIQFVCHGKDDPATYIINDDDGLYESGPDGNRMRHGTNPAAHLPYAFSVAPATGTVPKNANTPLVVTGTVLANDYRMAYAGTYTDVVILTINP